MLETEIVVLSKVETKSTKGWKNCDKNIPPPKDDRLVKQLIKVHWQLIGPQYNSDILGILNLVLSLFTSCNG